jgi:hypothetical protein
MVHKGLIRFAGLFVLCSVTSFANAGQPPVACDIARARYHLSSLPTFELSFVNIGKKEDWLSDLALKLTPNSGSSYWFLFDAGSARYTNLVSTRDVTSKDWSPSTGGSGGRPLGEMHYFSWSHNFQFDERVPKSGMHAPERIFLPDLAEVMWYRASPRIDVPQGVFVLDQCL